MLHKIKLAAGILTGIGLAVGAIFWAYNIALIDILTFLFPSVARRAAQSKGAFELMVDKIGAINIAMIIAAVGILGGIGIIVFSVKKYRKRDSNDQTPRGTL